MSTDRDGAHVPLVLDTLRGLLGELDPTRARGAIGADQSLTRELALGSLERVELAMRLEKAAGVELGETVLAEADTPRQIAAAIARARATPAAGPRAAPAVEAGAAARGPARAGGETADRRSVRGRWSRRCAGRSNAAPSASTSSCGTTTAARR